MCLEPGQLLPCRDKRFLGDVLSVVMVAEQPQCDPVGQLAVTVYELGVGIDVAFPGSLDEVAVVDFCSHAAPPVPERLAYGPAATGEPP